MSDVEVLLIGAGRVGTVHGQNLSRHVPAAEIRAVVDVDIDAAQALANRLGVATALGDPRAAIDDVGASAVVIASPTPSHADLAVAALEAGMHVLCEKPLAPTVEQARRVLEAVAASDASFVMGFVRRFDPVFAEVRERIDAGEIGEPLLVKSTGRGAGVPPPWAWETSESGGLVAEMNTHDVDTVRWLSGQEFRSVRALGRTRKRRDIAEQHPSFIDLFAANFELSEGGLATIDGAFESGYGLDARVEVYGSGGVIMAGSSLESGVTRVISGEGKRQAVRGWNRRFAEAFRLEVEHFVSVAQGESRPAVTAADGARAVEAVAATNRSISEEGSLVRIS